MIGINRREASVWALATVGGGGMLEVNINTNPRQSELVGDLPR